MYSSLILCYIIARVILTCNCVYMILVNILNLNSDVRIKACGIFRNLKMHEYLIGTVLRRINTEVVCSVHLRVLYDGGIRTL